MLIPNNPNIDFDELNRRIESEVQRYQQGGERPLPAFNPNPPLPAAKAYGWAALTQLDGQSLVTAAFPSLLGREAQPEEHAQWLARLNAGMDKFEFLATLRYSAEGKRRGVPVHGLRRARLRSAIRNTPLFGALLNNLYGWLKTDARHRYYMARFDLHTRQLDQHLKALSSSEASLLGILASARETIDAQQSMITQLQSTTAQLQERLNQQDVLNQAMQDKQALSTKVQQELRGRLAYLESQGGERQAPGVTVEPASEHMSVIPDGFYLAFENRFRGDGDTIRQRLSYYLPLIDTVAPLAAGLPLVDIGCGRGEWLGLLPDGIQRIGIDLNGLNVQACHEQGLQAELADGLAWLRQQPDGSLAAVTAFHVIEHLSFEQLHTLLDQCLRVLAPGGLIIFETPNPENLVSAATHFHTDPTHIHPLPPALSEFLLEYRGFENVQIHRLNPIPAQYALIEDSEVARRCNALFYGPQDYAVTAWKAQP